MAKGNKRSFVFFEDWWEVIESLPSIQQRHDALVAIIEYALHGKIPADPFIAFGTARMRKEIDESKTRWQQTCEKRREAGRKGLAKRWGKNDSNDSKQQQPIANGSNDSNCHNVVANDSKQQQPIANIADNDNLYEYKNKINNNNINVTAGARVRENFLNSFFSDERRSEIEQLCIARGFDSIDDFKRLARIVTAEWILTGKSHTSMQDAYRHLIDHCSKQKQAELRAARQTTPPPTPNNNPNANPRPYDHRPSRQERDADFMRGILEQFNSDD